MCGCSAQRSCQDRDGRTGPLFRFESIVEVSATDAGSLIESPSQALNFDVRDSRLRRLSLNSAFTTITMISITLVPPLPCSEYIS